MMPTEQWRPMTEPPSKSGRYVVAHRGGVAGHAYYLHPDDANDRFLETLGTVGWSQVPEFGPTHWGEPPSMEAMPEPAARFWPPPRLSPAERARSASVARLRLLRIVSRDRVELSPWRVRLRLC